MNKQFNKIHKLYKDIQEVYFDCGFINVVISMPIKSIHIGGIGLKWDLEKVYKIKLSTPLISIFTDEVYLNYEIKED